MKKVDITARYVASIRQTKSFPAKAMPRTFVKLAPPSRQKSRQKK